MCTTPLQELRVALLRLCERLATTMEGPQQEAHGRDRRESDMDMMDLLSHLRPIETKIAEAMQSQ